MVEIYVHYLRDKIDRGFARPLITIRLPVRLLRSVASCDPAQEARRPGQGYRFEVSDNDGLWNAIYVGAMAFRYAATKDPAARKQARQALDAMLELERLTGIPGYPGPRRRDRRGAEAGVDGVNLDETVRVPGETDKIWFRSPVDPTVWCKGDTSSDEMDGHYFAWYVYHDLVADAAEKAADRGRRPPGDRPHPRARLHAGRPHRPQDALGHLGTGVDQRRPVLRRAAAAELAGDPAYLKIAEHITGDAKYARAARRADRQAPLPAEHAADPPRPVRAVDGDQPLRRRDALPDVLRRCCGWRRTRTAAASCAEHRPHLGGHARRAERPRRSAARSTTSSTARLTGRPLRRRGGGRRRCRIGRGT